MIIEFNELKNININLIHKDYSYLREFYNVHEFKKARKTYRNFLIKELVGDEFRVNNQDMKLYTNKGEMNYSSSYSSYNIAVAISKDKLGIDIERYENVSLENIDIFSSMKEVNVLEDLLNTCCLIEKATFIWCLKESVGKLFNIGLSKGFKTFTIEKEDKFYLTSKLSVSEKRNIFIYYKILKDFCLVLSTFARSN